jgi:hypothetical protein
MAEPLPKLILSKDLFAQLSELVRIYRDYKHKLDLNQVLYTCSRIDNAIDEDGGGVGGGTVSTLPDSSSAAASAVIPHLPLSNNDVITRLDKLMSSLRAHMSSLPPDVGDQCISRLKELVRKGFK